MSDLHFVNHGSIITCTPQTEVGKRWLDANVNAEPYMWMGQSLCIEGFRNAYDVAMGAREDGLEVD